MGGSGWTGVIIAVAVLTIATVAGVLLRRRNGRFAAAAPAPQRTVESRPEAAPESAILATLGVTSGNPVTLVQFSTAFCGPCRTTRVLCTDVAARVPGVRYIDVDAESHLDAVRSLDIWRTPTLLVVDRDLTIRRRATGAPSRAELLAAVTDVLPRSALAEPAQAQVA